MMIPIEPVAKGRAKTRFINGRALTFTPKKTQEAQEAVGLTVKSIYNTIPFQPHIPLKLTATFYRTKSKWLPKRETLPFRKPDLDNFLKLLLDGINMVAIPDDAQITNMIIKKRWSTNGHGYIEFELSEDNDA